MKVLVLLICFLLSGCGTVSVIGYYKCPDGKIVAYVQSTCSTSTGSTALVTLDRYEHNPKINETKLIRSDASGVANSGNPVELLKQLPVTIPIF